MQLMPKTAEMYRLTDPYNLNQNIDAGVRHYRMCKNKSNGDTRLAYMKYNGGPNRKTFPPGGESEIYGKRCMNDLNKTTFMIVAML